MDSIVGTGHTALTELPAVRFQGDLSISEMSLGLSASPALSVAEALMGSEVQGNIPGHSKVFSKKG